MSNKKHNPSKKRMKVISFLLFAFLVWAIFTIYNQWVIIKDIQVKLNELEEEQQNAIDKKKDLEKKVYLLHDDDHIAELARRYYFLSKPGEIILISPEE